MSDKDAVPLELDQASEVHIVFVHLPCCGAVWQIPTGSVGIRFHETRCKNCRRDWTIEVWARGPLSITAAMSTVRARVKQLKDLRARVRELKGIIMDQREPWKLAMITMRLVDEFEDADRTEQSCRHFNWPDVKVDLGFWYDEPGCSFHRPAGVRRPRGVREWARCIWNVDIFFGPVPFLKCVALASLALSALIAWMMG